MKEILKQMIALLKNPNLIILCVNWTITLIGIAGSITLVCLNYEGVFSAIVYFISALSVVYSVYCIFWLAPTLQKRFNKAIKSNRYTKQFTEDYGFRTNLLSTISFFINLIYVVFNIVFFVLLKSIWYCAAAVYYFLLSALKGYVFYSDKRAEKLAESNPDDYYVFQLKNYRICGIFLFVLEIAMTAVVTLTVTQKKSMQSSNIMAIATAIYTFYKVISSIINIIKARRYKNPKIQTIRNIGLADAAISLVSLQITLVATFSDVDENMTILNAITGFVACALTIYVGINMIVKGTKKISALKKQEETKS